MIFVDSNVLLDLVGATPGWADWSAERLAARAHLAYRRRGGTRTGVLPDFFIGADALARGAPLLTRDPARYRAYFPGLTVIAPA